MRYLGWYRQPGNGAADGDMGVIVHAVGAWARGPSAFLAQGLPLRALPA